MRDEDSTAARALLHCLSSRAGARAGREFEELHDELLLLERLLAGHASPDDRQRAHARTAPAVRYDFAI